MPAPPADWQEAGILTPETALRVEGIAGRLAVVSRLDGAMFRFSDRSTRQTRIPLALLQSANG